MAVLHILFVGDIIGKPGISLVQTWLPSLIQKYKADLVIANGENFIVRYGIGLIRIIREFFNQVTRSFLKEFQSIVRPKP